MLVGRMGLAAAQHLLFMQGLGVLAEALSGNINLSSKAEKAFRIAKAAHAYILSRRSRLAVDTIRPIRLGKLFKEPTNHGIEKPVPGPNTLPQMDFQVGETVFQMRQRLGDILCEMSSGKQKIREDVDFAHVTAPAFPEYLFQSWAVELEKGVKKKNFRGREKGRSRPYLLHGGYYEILITASVSQKNYRYFFHNPVTAANKLKLIIINLICYKGHVKRSRPRR
jgi:hypothetical protein